MPPVHHQEAKVACTYRTVAKRFGGPSKGEWAATMSSERRWLAGQPRACSGRLTPRGEAQHVERKGQETARSRYQPFFRTPQEWPTYRVGAAPFQQEWPTHRWEAAPSQQEWPTQRWEAAPPQQEWPTYRWEAAPSHQERPAHRWEAGPSQQEWQAHQW